MNHQSTPDSSRGEILLIDDSVESLRLLSRLLADVGYMVRQAPSGELGLWTIQSRQPELVLLDLRMPVMSGFDVCRQLKADPATREIPVIFLSAADDATDKVEGLRLGAVDFIAKDFAPEEILARVNTHITLARVTRALEQERARLEERVQERTAELWREKALLQSVLDSCPDWIYVKDHDQRLLLANRTMADATALAPDALLGRREDEIFPMGGGAAMNEHATALVMSGGSYRQPRDQVTMQDGSQRVFDTFQGPLQDQQGKVYGVLCYRRDITERVHAESTNQRLQEQLAQAQKMQAIGQLVGGIAHDFNNILAIILGFAGMAETAAGQHPPDGDRLTRYMGEILLASRRAKELVAQLLTFSRGADIGAHRLAVANAIQDTQRLLHASLGAEVRLVFDIAPGLPEIHLRAVQFDQILLNLVLNARDASPPHATIAITAQLAENTHGGVCSSCFGHLSGDYVRLSVRDHGSGIDPLHLSKIFEPFFTTKEVGKGTGLGLSMVHGLVHSAGGHLCVDSSPGVGTECQVFLPVAQAATAAEPAVARPVMGRRSGHVLVVDDEPAIVSLVQQRCLDLGCRVTASTSSVDAWQTFSANPGDFDLLITDQSMPDMTGIELIGRIQSIRAALPIILCSGRVDVPELSQVKVDQRLTKPVPGEVLDQAIAELLRIP